MGPGQDPSLAACPSYCSGCISVAVMKHSDQTQLRWRRLTLPGRSPAWRNAKQELRAGLLLFCEALTRNSHGEMLLDGCFGLTLSWLPQTVQDGLPRKSPTPRGLGLPASLTIGQVYTDLLRKSQFRSWGSSLR